MPDTPLEFIADPMKSKQFMSLRGRGCCPKAQKESQGMPGPLSGPRIAKYWGRNFMEMGTRVLFLVKQKVTVKIGGLAAKRKLLGLPVDFIIDCVPAMVEYIGPVSFGRRLSHAM